MIRILICYILLSFTVLADQMDTVEYVDINKYLGRWYEVVSFPQSFQKDCFCSRADYTLKDDGNLKVLNSCNKSSPEGKLSTADGYAKIVDKSSNSKLKVTFFWPFFGDYWIIGLHKEYKYAVISGPDRSTLWVLSRTPILDSELLNEALTIAKSQGLDLTKLRYSSNEYCKY